MGGEDLQSEQCLEALWRLQGLLGLSVNSAHVNRHSSPGIRWQSCSSAPGGGLGMADSRPEPGQAALPEASETHDAHVG